MQKMQTLIIHLMSSIAVTIFAFFTKNFDFYSKLKAIDKLAGKLRKLIILC